MLQFPIKTKFKLVIDMDVIIDTSCPCGSGKKYKNCCLKKTKLGFQLNLKGKKAEDFVYSLSKDSFFIDWCYRNVTLPSSKEICDLLIVFDDVAIIWQIKDLKLHDDGKYKPSEVQKNLNQLITARNRIFSLKVPIELENPRRGKEIFNPAVINEVYLISALLGKGEDYFSFIENRNGHIIHTFTRDFTEIILSELNTIKDFVEYLRGKEALISIGNKITIMGGEEELLAWYLCNGRSFEEFKKVDAVMLDEGSWTETQKKSEFIAKKEMDEISYGWDEIINRAHTCGADYEEIAKELARTNRFERRCLSQAFYDAHVLAHKEAEKNVFHRILCLNNKTYCFVFSDEIDPREKRQALLSADCFIARGTIKENKMVIGIATEMKIKKQCSYDFCFLEISEWTDKEQKEMEDLQKKTGFFTNYTRKEFHEDEYPN